MRNIRFTARFRKDFERVERGLLPASLELELRPIITLLASDQPLPVKNRDHPRKGVWAGFRDCHVRPDLVLIYRKLDSSSLELNRLGSHSELFKK